MEAFYLLSAAGAARAFPKVTRSWASLHTQAGQRDHRFNKMSRRSPQSRPVKEMARPLPKTPDQWLKEILLALKDAKEAKPFARLAGTSLNDADLFHLAPLVCLKFRGRKLAGAEADRVMKGALANYVVNTEKGLTSNPKLAFALCYVAAHLVLDLVDEETAADIMGYCEEHFDGPGSASE